MTKTFTTDAEDFFIIVSQMVSAGGDINISEATVSTEPGGSTQIIIGM